MHSILQEKEKGLEILFAKVGYKFNERLHARPQMDDYEKAGVEVGRDFSSEPEYLPPELREILPESQYLTPACREIPPEHKGYSLQPQYLPLQHREILLEHQDCSQTHRNFSMPMDISSRPCRIKLFLIWLYQLFMFLLLYDFVCRCFDLYQNRSILTKFWGSRPSPLEPVMQYVFR